MASHTEDHAEESGRPGKDESPGDEGRRRLLRRPRPKLHLGEWVASAVVSLVVTAGWGWLSTSLATSTRWAVAGVAFGVVAAWFLLATDKLSWGAKIALLAVVLVVMGSTMVLYTRGDAAAVDDCDRSVEDDAIEVMIIWDGDEKRAFCEIADSYDGRIAVTSVGPEIGTALDQRSDEGNAPDVAIVAQPSLVRRSANAGRLCPVGSEVADRFPAQWRRLVSEQPSGSGETQAFGVPVKATDKSLIWIDTAGDAAQGLSASWTYDELVAWVGANVDNEAFGAPLSIPAGDRWPLTDLFENLLAGTAPDIYNSLARGAQINWDSAPTREGLTATLTAMADLLSIDGAFPGGPEGAATTSWTDLDDQLGAHDAGMVFGPSFLQGPMGNLDESVNATPRGFPVLPAGQPLVVGGDFAVVLAPASGQCSDALAAHDFVDWLTDSEAMAQWARRDRGFLTPNSLSPHLESAEPPPPPEENVRSLLTTALRTPPDQRLYFDLSDDQFGADKGDARAVWDTFGRFFRDVTGGAVSRTCAIDQVIADLEAEYRGDAPRSIGCA